MRQADNAGGIRLHRMWEGFMTTSTGILFSAMSTRSARAGLSLARNPALFVT